MDELKGGVGRWFRRRQLGSRPEKWNTDDYGFVIPTGDLLPIDRLLETGASLILGPPWLGKTTVARNLRTYLDQCRAEQGHPLNFGDNVWFTWLEEHRSQPTWWPEWRKSQDRACWIIDALDEGENRQEGTCSELLAEVERCSPQELSRLTLVLLSREVELPPVVPEVLDRIYKDGWQVVDLAPVDQQTARSIVGQSAFDRVLALIDDHGLQSVAAYPAALQYLRTLPHPEGLTSLKVWRGVLTELLKKERGLRAGQPPKAEIEDQFRAAARIAAVMTFSGLDEIKQESGPEHPDVCDLISDNLPRAEPTRQAAREALTSSMFCRGAGYRFAQKNVQQWMCAFGLVDVPLTCLKPLVTDASAEPRKDLAAVLGLLSLVTNEEPVRQWITSGGLPPSGLAPLSLADAVRVVDELERIAVNAPWRMSLWREDGLRSLKVEGLGDVLARRVHDKGRPSKVRQVAMDIASATEAREVVISALDLIQDSEDDIHLRRWAVNLVSHLGTHDQLAALSDFVRKAHPQGADEKAVVSGTIASLWDAGIWSMAEAARCAPVPEGDDVTDATGFLVFRLTKDMTLEAARVVVAHRQPWRRGRTGRGKGRKGRSGRRSMALFERAVRRLCEQESVGEDDLHLLFPVALRVHERRWNLDLRSPLFSAFAKSEAERRRLYVEDVRRTSRPRAKRRHRVWRSILQKGDIEWLFNKVCVLAVQDASVWDDFLGLTYAVDSRAQKLRVGAFVKEHDPDRFSEFKAARRRGLRRQRRWKRREQAEEQQQKRLERGIQDVVQNILENDALTPQRRMWNLAWVCFADEGGGPRNVVGRFSDLPDSVQERVLDACEAAVCTCQSTPIPDGRSFPAVIMYEAWCFRSLLSVRGADLQLRSDIVGAWLPSVLLFSHLQGQDAVLAECFRVQRTATEPVLLDGISRELRSGYQYMSAADRLPKEYWSEQVVSGVVDLVKGPGANAVGKAELLRVLADRCPTVAAELSKDLRRPEDAVTAANDPLCSAARDVLLVYDPEMVWPVVERDFEERGEQALVDLPSLYQWAHGFQAHPLDWPVGRLLTLARMLFQAYPAERDPEFGSGPVTAAADLRQLRSAIPRRFLEQGGQEAIAALETLAEEQPTVRQWYDYMLAQKRAKDLLTGPGTAAEAQRLPLPKVVRVLEDANYRLVRADADLLEVLAEQLGRIGESAADDLALLYLPESKGVRPKLRHEEILQLYLVRRLKDLLPGKVLDRETEIQFRRRLDIVVRSAVVTSALDFATVVIEVKWSENQKVATSLKEQLGDKYLRGRERTHGLYVVGWTGRLPSWASDGGPKPGKPYSCETLQQAFERQAHEYRQAHPEIHVHPVTLDLQWR